MMDKLLLNDTPLGGEKPAMNVSRLNFIAGMVLSTCLVATGPTLAQGLQLKDSALHQLKVLQQEKASRTPAQKKLDSKFIYEMKSTRGDPLMAQLPKLRSQVRYEANGQVKVDISTNVDNHAALEAGIKALGGKVINSHPRFNRVRATLPLGALESLAASDAVRSIRQADRMYLNVTSEGDIAHKADLAKLPPFSVDGTGERVCVLSDSVDSLKDLQDMGELPHVGILPDAVTGLPLDGIPGTSEGTAMLEIVHDLAPGALLYFATAGEGGEGDHNNEHEGEALFAQNIIDMHGKFGCTIMVDNVGYFAEAVFQDGIVAAAVNEVTDAGVLYFSAAGNSGNLNDKSSSVWEGNFVGIPGPPLPEFDGLEVLDFDGGTYANEIDVLSLNGYFLQWSDPQSGSENDYDLYILDESLANVERSSTSSQTGTQDPYEWILPNDVVRGWNLFVLKYTGDDRFMHLNTHGGELEIYTDGQIHGHAAAANAFSVAATSWDKNGSISIPEAFDGSESVETYSSDGPRQMFYNQDGSPITGSFLDGGGVVRQKPDITAADYVTVATPGFTPFEGTSASAAHAAAIAALMRQYDTSLDIDLVRTLFDYSSLDIEAPGRDRDSGVGIVMAYEALDAMAKMQENTSCHNVANESIENLFQCSNEGIITVGPNLTVTREGYLQLSSNTAISFIGEVSVKLGGKLAVINP